LKLGVDLREIGDFDYLGALDHGRREGGFRARR